LLCDCYVAEHLYWKYLVKDMADWIKTETTVKVITKQTVIEADVGMFGILSILLLLCAYCNIWCELMLY